MYPAGSIPVDRDLFTSTQNHNTIMQINKQLQLGSRKFIPTTQYRKLTKAALCLWPNQHTKSLLFQPQTTKYTKISPHRAHIMHHAFVTNNQTHITEFTQPKSNKGVIVKGGGVGVGV